MPPLLTRLRGHLLGLRSTLLVARQSRDFVPMQVAARSVVAPRLRVLCDRTPRPHNVIAKVFAAGGFSVVRDAALPHDAVFGRHPGATGETPIINGRHRGNQKSTVADTFAEVAGYDLAVDPESHRGPIVEKSEANSTRDGALLLGPISPERVRSGRVYQRLIETEDRGTCTEYRTPLYGGRVPFAYLVKKPAGDRFGKAYLSAEIREAAEVYTKSELDLLARFAEAMGLDCGEVDVLRDKGTGRIYVVDATQNAGIGMVANEMPRAERYEAVRRLAAAFEDLVHEWRG